MILDRIVAAKRGEVAEKKAETPLFSLEETIRGISPPRAFREAIGAGGAIIAEVKRCSPSRGLFREAIDPARIARQYEAHGAAAVSVLTDGPFFGGSNEDLVAVRNVVSLPILRKEFIIDPWQIYETRAIGADALLLIAAILDEEQLRDYQALAASLGLAALVEVHDDQELERALRTDASIIGINNRNLQTFVTEIRTSLKLAPLIPAEKITVSESGIRTRREIETLLKAGVRAFLIGETLITAPDIGEKLEEFLGR